MWPFLAALLVVTPVVYVIASVVVYWIAPLTPQSLAHLITLAAGKAGASLPVAGPGKTAASGRKHENGGGLAGTRYGDKG